MFGSFFLLNSVKLFVRRASLRDRIGCTGHVLVHRVVGTDHIRRLRRLHRTVRDDTRGEGLPSLDVLLAYLTCGMVP